MTLLESVRLGSQEPTILHEPPDVVSLAAADECIQLADAYGVCDGFPLSESQKLTLRNGLGERSDGLWAATRIADFGPRQGTGKNDKIAARELAGLILFGEELIIHTAHEFPTANESFLRLVSVFEAWDDLRSKVARIRYANGEQGIELLSGQRLKYRARTGGSGRGFAKADLIVYDEAQHLVREHVAASGPAKLANPNSQTWYSGSGGLTSSSVAWEMRRQAMNGTGGRLAYTEMSASIDGTPPDPLDRDVWYACIPGLGRWVTEEGVLALYDELGPDLFCREILCVWEPEPGGAGSGPIDLTRWAQLADPDSRISGEVSTAIDVSPDLKWATIASAGMRPDGQIHVEIGRRQPGTDWIVPFCRSNPQHGPYRVVGGSSPGAFLLPLLEDEGVWTVEVPATDVARATQRLIASVDDGTIHHLGSNEIAAALENATIKPYGDSQTWSRVKSSGDISALVAATVAVGGVRTDVDPIIRF
jgi:hypothetical protein